MPPLDRLPGGAVSIDAPGTRALGSITKPALWLSIGEIDPSRRGAPRKLDYLRAKPGLEGEHARAAVKFVETFGEMPRAIEIRLFAEFGLGFDIRYRAFAGAGADTGGGVQVARGDTNFAERGYVGGPDVLTVWRQNGEIEELETAGIDAGSGEPLDALAAELSLEIRTVFRFGVPSVLSFGSFAALSSGSKETRDTLWMKLRSWYGTFGMHTSWVIRPQLVVKPTTVRPIVEDRRTGEKKRIKSKAYVLDLILRETEDELLDRWREQIALTESAHRALYAPESAALPAPRPSESVDFSDRGIATPTAPPENLRPISVEGPPASPDEPALEAEPEDAVIVPGIDPALVVSAREMVIPVGSAQGRKLGTIFASQNADQYLGWLLRQPLPNDSTFREALHVFCQAEAPQVYAEWQREEAP